MTLKATFLGISLLLCAASGHAQTSVTVYGRLNVAIESFRNSSDANGNNIAVNRLSNDRSVLGFRGAEDLGDGLHAIFQIEGTVSPDTGAGGIAARDTRIGLEGTKGTIFGGNWVTPYNGATSSLDPFYPTTAGYMSIMGNGSASTTDNVIDTSSFDRRQQNSLHYWTPAWRGYSAHIAHGFNEERPVNGAKPSLTSLAFVYDEGPVYVTIATERHHEYQGPGLNDSGAKIAFAYKFGETRIATIAEKLRYETSTGTLERKSYYVSLTHQFGNQEVRFGVARAADVTGDSTKRIGFMRKGEDTGATHLTLGYDYILSKRTSFFVYYTHLRNDRNGIYDLAINSLGVSPGSTIKGIATGIRHNF
ncbi:porin [Undibacterium terreum]|uniref:Porin n=1 Tax=Undibacterium terreum TaxID=1224302 RepID=A0A916UTE7_9BURK|nr:porin [Undibacterium terreum]GGC85932.1 porin [Undibacterium terreum]